MVEFQVSSLGYGLMVLPPAEMGTAGSSSDLEDSKFSTVLIECERISDHPGGMVAPSQKELVTFWACVGWIRHIQEQVSSNQVGEFHSLEQTLLRGLCGICKLNVFP